MRIILSGIFFLLSHSLFAQNNAEIKGIVTDAASAPLAKATVSVVSIQDSIVVTYSLTDDKGKFDLVRIPARKDLMLHITHINSTPYSRKINMKPREVLNLDTVFMAGIGLDEVVITQAAPIRLNGDTLEYKVAETSLVTFTSGMILVYGEGTLAGTNFWGYTIPMSLPLLVAWKMGIPYGAYAHSFDSFGDAGGPGRPYFKKLLENAQFVFCRDGDSVKYIRSVNIQAPNLMFVPDGTVSFGLRDDEWADKLMQRNNLISKDFLIIIPRTYLGGGKISPTIGETRSLAHMAKIRSVIQQWVARTGKKVLIGAEVFRDFPNAKALVYDLLPEETRKHCVMLDEFWTTEQAVSLYRHARIILSMELHSFLLAIPQGIPTVVPTFKESGRKISMLNDFKVPDWYFDIDEASADTIADTIDGIHRNYQQATERLTNDVIPHIRQLEQQAMDIMAAASRRV